MARDKVNLQVINRTCGDCTACCTLVGITELDKGQNVRCVHLADKGCGIYGNHPASCKEFSCEWLRGLLPEQFRPDKCGVAFGFGERTDASGFYLIAYLGSGDISLERVRYLAAKVRRDRVNLDVLIFPRGWGLNAGPSLHDQQNQPAVSYRPLGGGFFLAQSGNLQPG